MIRWAVSRPAVVWAVAVAVVLGGGVSFTRLALATRTTVELPRLQISSGWQGASAELVEMYVSSPIESAAQGVRGVRQTSSTSRDGISQITVELDPKADDPRAAGATAWGISAWRFAADGGQPRAAGT